MDIDILKTEIDTDPKTLGISFDPQENEANNRAIADKLNEVGASGESVDVSVRQPYELQAVVVGSEFEGLSAAKQRGWLAIVGLSEIPMKNVGLRAQVTSIWSAGATRTALGNLQTKSATRAEVLFGEKVSVTSHDVHLARRQT